MVLLSCILELEHPFAPRLCHSVIRVIDLNRYKISSFFRTLLLFDSKGFFLYISKIGFSPYLLYLTTRTKTNLTFFKVRIPKQSVSSFHIIFKPSSSSIHCKIILEMFSSWNWKFRFCRPFCFLGVMNEQILIHIIIRVSKLMWKILYLYTGHFVLENEIFINFSKHPTLLSFLHKYIPLKL